MDLLTMAQVLERTKLSRRTLFRVRERGEFPQALLIGRVMVWRADHVAEWCERFNPTAARTAKDT